MDYVSEKMSLLDAKPIQLHLLKTITEDFSKKLKIGSGGYGEVYKGVLNGHEIAIKKLFPVHGVDDEAFDNEFRNLKKVQHKNVIRMIGYCYEIAHRDVEYQGKLVWSQVIDRALCFEYMKGGSLAKHISVWSTHSKSSNFPAGHPSSHCSSPSTLNFQVQEYWKKKMQTMEGYRWDETDLLGVMRCIDMAMRCVEDDRDKGPYIKDIINELNKLDSEVTEMLKKDPKPPIGQLKRKNRVNDLEAVKQNKCLNDLGKDIVVDPSQELCFLFEPNKDIRCCLQLIDKGESSHIAFNINTDVNKYKARPNKGIIAPYSKHYITLTLRAQEEAPPNMQCGDVLVVQGIRVSEHFTSDEITPDYLEKASAVYEVALPIVYVALDHKPLSLNRET